MKEAFAITGFVPTEVAKRLKEHKSGTIEITAERNEKDVFTQVDASHVAEARIGADSGGKTMVQLILNDNAPVHTIVRSAASDKGLQLFRDPALGWGRIHPPIRVIFV